MYTLLVWSGWKEYWTFTQFKELLYTITELLGPFKIYQFNANVQTKLISAS